jgi:Fe-S-cluster-containing hydrogenase component 2
MAAIVDKEKCGGCGTCVDACPVGAIKIEDGKAVVSEGDCIECGACTGACPCEAISLP